MRRIEDLLRCPKCRNPNPTMSSDSVSGGWNFVRCGDCSFTTGMTKGEEMTISHWNAIKRPVEPKPEIPSAVEHPSHYGGADDPYEAIKVIEAWLLGFNLGNAVKYISRAGKKDPSKHIQDLEKAAWYLNREIQKLKENAP